MSKSRPRSRSGMDRAEEFYNLKFGLSRYFEYCPFGAILRDVILLRRSLCNCS